MVCHYIQVLTYVHMTCIDELIGEVIQWAQDHTIIIICPLLQSNLLFFVVVGLEILTWANIGKTVLFLVPWCPCYSNSLSFTIIQCLHTHSNKEKWLYTWYRNWLYLKLSHEKLVVVGLFLLHIAPKQSHWQRYWSRMKLT